MPPIYLLWCGRARVWDLWPSLWAQQAAMHNDSVMLLCQLQQQNGSPLCRKEAPSAEMAHCIVTNGPLWQTDFWLDPTGRFLIFSHGSFQGASSFKADLLSNSQFDSCSVLAVDYRLTFPAPVENATICCLLLGLSQSSTTIFMFWELHLMSQWSKTHGNRN